MVKGVVVDCFKYVVVDFFDVVICFVGLFVRLNFLVVVYFLDVVILIVFGVKSFVDDVFDIVVEGDDGVFVVVLVEIVFVVMFVGVDGFFEIIIKILLLFLIVMLGILFIGFFILEMVKIIIFEEYIIIREFGFISGLVEYIIILEKFMIIYLE